MNDYNITVEVVIVQETSVRADTPQDAFRLIRSR